MSWTRDKFPAHGPWQAANQKQSSQLGRGAVPAKLVFPLHAEALLPEHLRQLHIAVLGKVDPLFLLTGLVNDKEVWVVPIHPLHLHVLPLFPALLVLQPAAHLIEMVQLSSLAR